MRLRQIRDLLGKYNGKLTYTEQRMSNGNYEVIGLQKAINTIDRLSPLGFLDDDIARLKVYPTVYLSKSPQDKMILAEDVHKEVRRTIRIAKEKIEGFQKLISNSIPENEENVVSVKLPQYDNLNDLSNFFRDLNKALKSGLKNDQIKGNYHLQNFDTGSLWIDLFISAGAINFFGQLITTAMNVKKQSYHLEIARIQLELSKAQKEHIDGVRASFDELLDGIVEKEMTELKELENLDDETSSRVKASIRMLSELITKGTQFHAPLNAPKEVTEAFPEPPKPEALDKPQSLIEQVSSYLEDTESEE
ncbi:hypothetical protein ABEP16_07640 [Priestia aryabhattai]|uniref:hypothetical protein n=1 Tax=Priestia aryabhattai TaxID=412384 RepID=UPI003D2BAFEE